MFSRMYREDCGDQSFVWFRYMVNDPLSDLVKFPSYTIKHNTPIEMLVTFVGLREKHGNKHVLGSTVIVKTRTKPLVLWLFWHRIKKWQSLINQVLLSCSLHPYNQLGHELISFCVLCFMNRKICSGLGRYTQLYRKVCHWWSYGWLRFVQ
jgi:hypothetical protein